jgi:hypothetical protein
VMLISGLNNRARYKRHVQSNPISMSNSNKSPRHWLGKIKIVGHEAQFRVSAWRLLYQDPARMKFLRGTTGLRTGPATRSRRAYLHLSCSKAASSWSADLLSAPSWRTFRADYFDQIGNDSLPERIIRRKEDH